VMVEVVEKVITGTITTSPPQTKTYALLQRTSPVYYLSVCLYEIDV
jgi:hypothetical protein